MEAKLKVFLFATIVGLSITACAPTVTDTQKPPVIGGKDDLRIGPEPIASASSVKIPFRANADTINEITPIRHNGLREAAQSYGSQMGYSRRSWEIMKMVEDKSTDLNEVFGFDRVVSQSPIGAGVIVPPIVSRSFAAFESASDGRSAATADEYLTIVRAGRISSVVPTWRDYLLMPVGQVDEPAQSLLPENAVEKKLFEDYFTEAWDAGRDMADADIEARLARLVRDYAGMLEYRRMVNLGMINRMIISDADYGVTGGGTEMRIGERTVEVVTDAAFQANPEYWKPATITSFEEQIVKDGGLDSLIIKSEAK